MTMTLDQWIEITQAMGIAAAVERLEAAASPREVAEAYDAWMREVYWKRKRIDLAAALAEAGITLCRRESAAALDDQVKNHFDATAKMLAYNLGSFAWPGWDEPGIHLTPDLVAKGLAAARLNLELAITLNRPAEKVRNAHWLIGAQLLAAGGSENVRQALVEFELAMPADHGPAREMTEGYVLLARQLLQELGAHAALAWLTAALLASADTDAQFFGRQLQTAQRVFARG